MKLCNRILSVLLAITLCAGLLPAEVFAYAQPDPAEKPAEITTAEGETVEVDDEWEETYPYGVFLFADSQANLIEGGDQALSPGRVAGPGHRFRELQSQRHAA